MKKLYYILLFAISLLYAAGLTAQSTAYAYDKEKVYVQTNHVFFSPGGTVFYKIYLVRGSDNKPFPLSNTVYVEVLGPSGTVLEKQTYPVENGYSEGSYTLSAQAAGGIYRLRAYTSWMRNEKDSTLFTRSFTVQEIIAPRVLMKLDFDKKGYGPGDEVIANFSMRSLDDAPIKYHSGEFTVSLDGQEQKKADFTTDANGKARLSFTLPRDLHTPDGLLNIEVSYDAHTESIARSIPITLNKIDLQFLPEGGSLVAGLPTNIAFKAINEFGKPVDVRGVIRDNNDQIVASFDSYKFGMGVFPFTPRPGARYTATILSPIDIKERYVLPQAAPDGVVMNISKDAGIISIKCSATSPMAVRIVGRTKDITYYSQDLHLKKGGNEITVREDLFPAGIAQFTLYTSEKRPLAERLVFLNSNKQLHVTLSTDKKLYLPREKVRMTITTTDEQGQPVPSNFSLSVVDDKLWTLADDRQDNILSWLLMSSELRGPIEEPPFYFKKGEPKAPAALDLVMLTNGYRYFDFIDNVIRNRELTFSPDESNIVSGVVTNEKGQPVAATVFLAHNIPDGKAWKLRTDSNGRFYFSGLSKGGDYLLIAQSLHDTEKVKLELQQNGIGYDPLRGAPGKQLRIEDRFDGVSTPVERTSAPAPASQQQSIGPLINLDNRHAALEDVVVVGYGTMLRRNATGSITTIYSADLKAIPSNGMFPALEGKVAGLIVTPKANPGETPLVQIRGAKTLIGGSEPLIVIDGVPQEKYDLAGINVNDIENITVLKDAAAIALYGARAVNGVIVIQSRTLRNEKLRFDLTKKEKKSQFTTGYFTMKGPAYTVARRFYAPQYHSTVTDVRNDYRETIYWNPVVQTDRDGRAIVEFYNSDASTTFRAIAEGIGYNGNLGRADTTYAARAAISVDAKIPPYLTVGDQALIPVVIKNNSSGKLEALIGISVPNHMYTGNFDNAVILDPGVSREVLVPLSSTAPADGEIRIHVSCPLGNETIDLPVSSVAKGFPVIETVAGNVTTTRDLHIGQTLPGSLHARFTLYKDLEGQLLHDIESMLTEPHGCFEQTSSATYPNIFILKYLRQTGKSNPAIERKAMSYIEHGYKKLIGFETSENGFEWFGHTPAHGALTAYGLLEFTDMKEFIDVDKKMLQRTKDFLLRRRDGQGGFKVTAGMYGRFAAMQYDLANIYIVYALTQAGYGNEIRPEYAAAVKKTLESNDAYQLAMMALAAGNMKNDDDYRLLMDKLKTSYLKNKLSAKTSIVSSGEGSLHVETLSLYALALMRDRQPDLGVVAELISKILASKSYFGYGSTQGTVLALQAVTEYSRLATEQIRAMDVRLTINGRTLAPNDSIAAFLHTGENAIAVEYSGQGKGIPYNLEVAYQTLTPPNSGKAELALNTVVNNAHPHVGETVRMTISVDNSKDSAQPMAIAKIGIPAGLSLQPWQLKELMDQKQVAYYEIFDNYLVLYWMGFAAGETKKIQLDLKAEIPGSYKAKASNVYLYYTPEYKHWNEGLEVEVRGNR
ncbi:MAG TPA: TonB-dependent receptor plug domain-containing protein [Puia sp.]|nr:TonB-dependent receptor plug domain-containing protein [Puia sp.]